MLDDKSLTNPAMRQFFQASRDLDAAPPSRAFHDFDVIARMAFIGALHGNEILTNDIQLGIFSYEDDPGGFPDIVLPATIFTNSEMSETTRRLMASISKEPGMEHATGLEFAPEAGEFALLVHEGPESHICAAAVFRLSVQEGTRRSLEDNPWSEQAPGRTVEVALEFRAASIRRSPNRERTRSLERVISAYLAQRMTQAIKHINESLAEFGQHVWIQIGARAAGELRKNGPVASSLINTLLQAIDTEVEGLSFDGAAYAGLDMVEAIS